MIVEVRRLLEDEKRESRRGRGEPATKPRYVYVTSPSTMIWSEFYH